MCLLLLGLALGFVGAGLSSAQVSPTGNEWQKIPDVPANVDFRDVFMAAGTLSGIAVGQEGDHGAAYDLEGRRSMAGATRLRSLALASASVLRCGRQ